jgi:hypothetical protein
LQKLRLLGSLLFAVRLPAEGGDSALQKPPYQPFTVSGLVKTAQRTLKEVKSAS